MQLVSLFSIYSVFTGMEKEVNAFDKCKPLAL